MCPMSSAIASGGQCEVPEGGQMLWEAELGAASRECSGVPCCVDAGNDTRHASVLR